MNWQILKGKFIVIDGPDGSGKSTQAKLLSELIAENGIETELFRDPGSTDISEKIRHILLDNANTDMSIRCETMLYMASRAQLFDQKIAPALALGKCVICDRWLSSTYAYQAVAGKIGLDYVLKLADTALARSWPDMTVIIDIPAENALARIGDSPDRMESKPAIFHKNVCKAFLSLAHDRDDFHVIDGSGTIQQVHKMVKQTTASKFAHKDY